MKKTLTWFILPSLISLILILSGCRNKVIQIEGSLIIKPAVASCEHLYSYEEYEDLVNQVKWLTQAALQTESVKKLEEIAHQLKALDQDFKNKVRPSDSTETLLGTYTWAIQRNQLPPIYTASNLALSTNGIKFPLSQLKLKQEGQLLYFVWQKPMSLIEYCTFRQSTTAFVEIVDGQWREYLRLIVRN